MVFINVARLSLARFSFLVSSLHYLALRKLYMHHASSHKRRYNIFRESELDIYHLSNKYKFYLGTQKLETFSLLQSMK